MKGTIFTLVKVKKGTGEVTGGSYVAPLPFALAVMDALKEDDNFQIVYLPLESAVCQAITKYTRYMAIYHKPLVERAEDVSFIDEVGFTPTKEWLSSPINAEWAVILDLHNGSIVWTKGEPQLA